MCLGFFGAFAASGYIIMMCEVAGTYTAKCLSKTLSADEAIYMVKNGRLKWPSLNLEVSTNRSYVSFERYSSKYY